MDKSNPPRSFGVFKPVGHTVIAFKDDETLEAATRSLLAQGFDPAELVRYTPDEMKAQVDADLAGASMLASVGQELNLVKAHRALAENGCGFLVVHAPDEARAERVDSVVRSHHAASAQRYGSFLVQELIDQPVGENQVFESPDRGLDVDVDAAAQPHP